TAAFFLAVFLAAAFTCCALAALTAAHRFLVAATILAKPSLLILRFALGASNGAGGSYSPLVAAHRFFCAIAMRRCAAAEILRFVVGASGVEAASGLATGKEGTIILISVP